MEQDYLLAGLANDQRPWSAKEWCESDGRREGLIYIARQKPKGESLKMSEAEKKKRKRNEAA
jgi:hypothetical protein